ncbi:MAG: alcohol dehydrogenase catalytic domain-containing protein [Pseudomonadota bacterium]
MKALIYEGPTTLVYREAPEPEVGAASLIEIAHVGICGSDMHAYAGHDPRRPAPLILGHEAAGTVIAGPLSGQRVTINPLVTCGVCAACVAGRENLCAVRQIISMPPREGAFAERVAVPPQNLVPLPDHVTTAAAALVEPIACGWHAVRRAREVLPVPLEAARCVVFGGGAIGLGAALVLAAEGAREIHLVEPQTERRAIACAASGARGVDPADSVPDDAHLIIDGVGIEATRAAASAAAAPGGVIAHIGLGGGGAGLDIRRMTLQEIAFIGTYTYTAEDFRQTAQALFDGRLGTLDWAEVRDLAAGASAFADIQSGRVPAPKIVLQP